MIAKELIKLLKEVRPDAKILVATSTGTLVEAQNIGTIIVIPTRQNKNLLPGFEWRVPVNSNDESEQKRENHFYIG